MLQTTNQDAPPAPRPPTSVTTTGADGKPITLLIPQSEDAVAALRARREELSNQLTSVTDRRHALAQEINSASGASKEGLEARLRILDQRIVQLESDIAATGQLLTSAPDELMASGETQQAPNDDWGEGMAVGMGTALFGLGVIGVFRRFRRRRRGISSTSGKALPDESAQRLERVEHAVEAIAIEVERISEGQRFVTKLLAENHQSGVTIPAASSRQ